MSTTPATLTPATAPGYADGTPAQLFAPELAEYAYRLILSGFTVWAHTRHHHRRADGMPVPAGYFTYSRLVTIPASGNTPEHDMECFGTVQQGDFPRLGEPIRHTMPLHPSRLNGSGATIGARWGDPDTLGFDGIDPYSVRMAEIVARPVNWCPFNAEPTPEAVAASDRAHMGGRSVAQRYYRGALLPNRGRAEIFPAPGQPPAVLPIDPASALREYAHHIDAQHFDGAHAEFIDGGMVTPTEAVAELARLAGIDPTAAPEAATL